MFSQFIYNEKMLLLRATLLTGNNIIDIIKWTNYAISKNFEKDKGFIGKLIEFFLLGKKTNNKYNQDIPHLGIEIKTITIYKNNNIINDSFICSLPLLNKNNLFWYKSKLYNKLSKILWIPIIVKNKKTHMFMKIIGQPLLWKPSVFDKIKIYNDWIKFIELFILGQIKHINYYNGSILLVKNKSEKKKLTKTIDNQGKIIFITPKSFYLKKEFIKSFIKV
ncbi:hypothetical protein GJT88_02125 [Enterobacteriaceae endosymbiont of Donacia tomentosa]|uniref:MutH/Sau3AI family endonuclease n=1 Tax=Enterobacteriaceae endosymbiont of Donacia tomentosa TaxID=2675787 RepID=UPI001448E1F4|nr:MutH/Sau3AI family endonuclease [Enterobacteriaceae endosymbiont of Donacia tomentosa]QJC31831.1 hypothetical protein GJT88_02125 [Enterobacteriaceae endosymbiont of Donacia tomentosa]